MQYEVEDIIEDVRIAIDENREAEPLIADGIPDTLTLKEIILSKIEDGVTFVEMDAPTELLDGGVQLQGDINWFVSPGNGGGYIVLPKDFMRMVVFKMSDWSVPSYSVITTEDPSYLIQKSKFKGVKGNPEKPVTAIVPHPDGLALEYYSSYDEDANVEVSRYLPKPKITNGKVDICSLCYRACVYYIAYLTLTTRENEGLAEKLKTIAENIIS